MTRAIVWKEFREQGLIALTLMVLGTGVLIAAAALADPPSPGAGPADVIRFLGAGRLATVLLAVTAGTVCGGALFAAEREAGTIGFLESLPAARWDLWQAKLTAGSLLVFAQVGFIVAVAGGLGLVETAGAIAVMLYALLAFVWGMMGSTVARTTLGSVGVAVPAATVAAVAFLVPVVLVFQPPGSNLPRPEGGFVFLALMFATPLGWSAHWFTRPDRARAADDAGRVPTVRRVAVPKGDDPVPPAWDAAGRPPGLGLKALVWLSARQLAGPGLFMSGFALVFGLGLLLPAVQPVLVWPALVLTAGVLAGVTMFADEQIHGTARFWGERRLPVGRVWAVKLAVHAALAVWLAALVAFPAVVRAAAGAESGLTGRGGPSLAAVFHSLLFAPAQLGPQSWKYLLVPLAYGFAAGHLCGLVFRKPVVAAGVAGLVGGTGAALWVPSLLAGGVHHWQVWVPPALVLLTARPLMRAWTADRLASRPAVLTLAGGGGAAALFLAAALGYRVAEVPDDPGAEDDIRYVVGLGPVAENDSGRGFRTAAERFAKTAEGVPPDRPALAANPRPGRQSRLDDPVEDIARVGWPPQNPAVGQWLRRVYELDRAVGEGDEPWYVLAARSARQPTGMYEHPLRTGSTAGTTTLLNGRRMGGVVVAHGLRLQDERDPAAFPDDLRTALALGRSMRNGSIVVAYQYGVEVARTALAGTHNWLARLDGRPDLLRAALAEVLADEPTDPFDPTPHLLAERYVVRELVKGPAQWLPVLLTPPGEDKEQVSPIVDLITLSWSVPWERERGRRLVGLGAGAETDQGRRQLLRGRPGAGVFTARVQTPVELADLDRQLRTHRRAVQIMLAARLYQEDTGTVPKDLAALVARNYLPAVPADPYDGLPFRYRISDGKELHARPSPGPVGPGGTPPPAMHRPGTDSVRLRPGQAVLWSIGPNHRDDGGQTLPAGPPGLGRGDDIVFLVPLPPHEK